MKTNSFFLIFVLTFVFSCSKKNENNPVSKNPNSLEAMKKFKPNKDLIEFKIIDGLTEEQVNKLNGNDFRFLNSKEFNPKTDTIRYENNEIYISYLTFLTSGPEYKADFKIKADSLILELKPFYDIVMTEGYADRLIFRIKNTGNKKFKIAKGI